MRSLKKLCAIFLFITIANCAGLCANDSVVSGDGYFYNSTSYEGFAGYVAVITPEITEVSNSMKQQLKIAHTDNHIYDNQQSHQSVNNSSFNKQSSHQNQAHQATSFSDTVTELINYKTQVVSSVHQDTFNFQ